MEPIHVSIHIYRSLILFMVISGLDMKRCRPAVLSLETQIVLLFPGHQVAD